MGLENGRSLSNL